MDQKKIKSSILSRTPSFCDNIFRKFVYHSILCPTEAGHNTSNRKYYIEVKIVSPARFCNVSHCFRKTIDENNTKNIFMCILLQKCFVIILVRIASWRKIPPPPISNVRMPALTASLISKSLQLSHGNKSRRVHYRELHEFLGQIWVPFLRRFGSMLIFRILFRPFRSAFHQIMSTHQNRFHFLSKILHAFVYISFFH